MKKFFYNISGIILIALIVTSIIYLEVNYMGKTDAFYIVCGTALGIGIFTLLSSIVLLIGAILRKIASWFKK